MQACFRIRIGSFLALQIEQLKKAAQSEGPPGYVPDEDAKPKTKAAKRNERRKEKKHQVQFLVFLTILSRSQKCPNY